jgi:hypothetical protein
MSYPQVVLFGAISGNWRKEHVIPVLDEMGVTYYDPTLEGGWNEKMGAIEVSMMANCETIIMVINRTSPAFTSLAETGWAALGAAIRGQHFILQIDQDYTYHLREEITALQAGKDLQDAIDHWVRSSRYLALNHARQFDHPNIHVVDDMAGVVAALRDIYGKQG